VTPEEHTEDQNARKDFARQILLGGSGPKTPTRKIIGRPAARARKNPWAGGFRSNALGVSPDQVEAATAAARAGGSMADFDPETGAAIMYSQRDYDRLAEATGLKTGRDGYQMTGEDDHKVDTGREAEMGRQAFRRDVMEGI